MSAGPKPEAEAPAGVFDVDEACARKEPLRRCVRTAVDRYFETMDGHEASDLFRLVMKEVEAPLLEAVLAHTRGNQTRAAGILGINRATLRKKLKQYGLE